MDNSSSVKNSVFDTDFVLSIVSEHYCVSEPLHCELIRTGFNHNYLIQTAETKFVLRIYLNGKPYIRHANDFRFELELLDFLCQKDIPVVRPVANKQDEWLATVDVQGEVRHLALFHFVDGIEIHKLDIDDVSEVIPLLEQFGTIMARIHLAASQFQSRYQRYHLNLDYMLDRSLQLLEQHLRERDMGDIAFFKPTAEEIRLRIQELPISADTYGPIHADFNVGNIFWDAQAGLTILDFDCGGYGWYTYDLAAPGIEIAEFLPHVLKGYESVRPLSALEKELIPIFVKLRWIWDIGDMLSFIPLWGEPITDNYLRECTDRLRGLMEDETNAAADK